MRRYWLVLIVCLLMVVWAALWPASSSHSQSRDPAAPLVPVPDNIIAQSDFVNWLLGLSNYELAMLGAFITTIVFLVVALWRAHVNKVGKTESRVDDIEKRLVVLQKVALMNMSYRHRVRTHDKFLRDVMRYLMIRRPAAALDREEDMVAVEAMHKKAETDAQDEKDEAKILSQLHGGRGMGERGEEDGEDELRRMLGEVEKSESYRQT